MKNVRKAIYELLRDDAGVAALASTRIYPIQLPQGITAPSVVYSVVSEDTDYNMNGPSGLVQIRMQINAWALTQALAFDLSDAAKNVLSGFRGSVAVGTDSPPDEISIKGIFHDIGQDRYDDLSKLFGCQRDYMVWFWDH